MRKIFILLTTVLGCTLNLVQAQSINMGQGTTHTATGCAMTVHDYGGITADYAPNRDDTLTIFSNSSSNSAVTVEIDLQTFDVHPSDTLFIYNGPNTQSPILDVFNNGIVGQIAAATLKYAATITNPTGAITLRLKTDGSGEGAGFDILTGCDAPCQRINVKFDTVLSNKYPKLADDGFYYIDLCPYDTLHLVAYGEYPDNYFSYTQTDATSTFHWDLGVAEFDSLGYNAVDYYFESKRGFDASLSITDSAGCISYIPQVFRIRTSDNPIRSLATMPEICTGQEVNFTTGYDYISSVQLDTIGSAQATSLAVSDTIFLPDGQICNGSCAYTSPVTFTAFAPSATVTSANDILYVRLSIEHSYVGDLWINLTCPSQKRVSLLKKYAGSSSGSCANAVPASEQGWAAGAGVSNAHFGVYYKPDNCSGNCNGVGCPMGQCWNYCWSNATNQGYQYACGNGYVYENCNHVYVNSPYGSSYSGSTFVDSTNVANMTNVYHPDGSFANLIGCPLNGTWSIQVVDAWGIDNGYICGWEMALDPHLQPADWQFNVSVDTTYIIGPGATGSYVIPDTAGDINYTIRVVDEFGCHYDTNTVVKVTPAPRPDLGADKEICIGEILTLDADTVGLHPVYHWNTGASTRTINVVTQGEYTVDVTTSNASQTLFCRGSDTVYVKVNPIPEFDVRPSDTAGCAPLKLRFTNNTTPDDVDYAWYVYRESPNGLLYTYSSTQKEPSFELVDPGVYSILLYGITSDGCRDSLLKWSYITVNAQPIAEFEADPAISLMAENNGLVNFINYSDSTVMRTPGTTFYWDFADGERDTENISPQHTYTQWGDYDVTLHIETEAGCASEIVHTVTVDKDLEFPNVITPNGDGINDVFAIQNMSTNINPEDPDKYRNNKLYIFDRWGNRVYYAENYDTFARDGKIEKGSQFFDGHGLSDGVYYYSFYFKGKAKTVNYNGSMTILR